MTDDPPASDGSRARGAGPATPDGGAETTPDGGTEADDGGAGQGPPVSETLESTATLAADGRAAAAETEETIEEIALAASEVRQHVRDLDEHVDQIAEVVEVINDIAEQTNVLALNANIEAARAGEGSEGFAVVAQEVKNLAEDAHARTGEIERAVAAIESSTDRTVEDLEAVNERISEGMGSSRTAVTTFEEIRERVEAVREDLPDAEADRRE